jgi:integrase/recombinase XerD
MHVNLDIHNLNEKYLQVEEFVRRSDVSSHNKELILAYRDACMVKGVCGRYRIIVAMYRLVRCARLFGKDFDRIERADIERLIAGLLNATPAYRPSTVQTFKITLKSFLTWVSQPDDFPTKNYPALVSWMRSHLARKDQPRLDRSDLLTPTEVDSLLAGCVNPRDRALIAMLWEMGSRISEVGNLRIRHLAKVEYGYHVALDGKTGKRTPLIVSSAPELTMWLHHHPFRHDPQSPVWVHYGYTNNARHLRYSSIRSLLRRLIERTGLKKRVYPHLFRHSRATFMVASGTMNEQQAKQYFGWAPNSTMLGVYAHLMTQDTDAAVLRLNNLTPPTTQQRVTTRGCPTCQEMNPIEGQHCLRCGRLMDIQKAYDLAQRERQKDDLLIRMATLLASNGMIEDAVTIVHQAGLGSTLQKLTREERTMPRTREEVVTHERTERV